MHYGVNYTYSGIRNHDIHVCHITHIVTEAVYSRSITRAHRMHFTHRYILVTTYVSQKPKSKTLEKFQGHKIRSLASSHD